METQPLEIRDFTGGLTDEPVGAAVNQFHRMDNILLNREGDPVSRPGSVLFDSANPQLPSGNQRVGSFINFNRDMSLFAQSGPNLYLWTNPGWSAVTGTAGAALLGATSSAHVMSAEWRRNLFLVNDQQTPPVRVYYDDNSSSFVARTAGLPFMATPNNFVPATALSSLITLANDLRTQLLAHMNDGLSVNIALANDLKAKFNAHIVDLTRHQVADNTHVVSTANATDLASLVTLTAALVTAYDAHFADANLGAAWVYHYAKDTLAGTITYDDFTDGSYTPTPSDLSSCSRTLYYLQLQFNTHDANNTTHHAGTGHQSVVAYQFAQHAASDLTALGYLTAPAATDLASLQTLTAQLLISYDLHFNDSARAAPSVHKLWHNQNPLNNLQSSRLLSTTAPTSYPDIASALNDLKLRYSLHVILYDVHWGYGLSSAVSTGFVTGVTAGANVPLDLTAVYSLANTLKIKMNSHKARQGAGTPHKSVGASYYKVTAANATDFASLATLVDQLRISLTDHTNDVSGEASAMHTGTGGAGAWTAADTLADVPADPRTDVFGSFVDPGNAPAGFYDLQLSYLLEIAQKFTHHQAQAIPHGGAGSSYINLDPVPTPNISIATYTYALHYFYQFTSFGVTYQIAGPVSFFQASRIVSFDSQTNTIQNIPVLSNSGNLNYDTANILVKIARTTATQGTQWFYVGSVANGTTSFVDRFTDTNLVNQSSLYTSGGIVQSDPPPYAKYIHVVNNLAYYGNFTDQGISYPNRIRQSLPSTLDGVPGSFFVDLPQENVGISSAKGIPIVWTKSKTYRIEGTYDLLGRGSIQAIAIHDSVGLSGSFSPVQIEEGLIFAGSDGWYFTDGYQVKKINKHWPTTYGQMMTSARAPLIRGDLDIQNKRVYWGCSLSGSENDTGLVLDLNFPISDNSVFTTWSNSSHLAPTAWCYFNGQMIRGDSRGYVFKHDPSYLTDPKVDATTPPLSGKVMTIRYDIRSAAFDFATLMFRKWVPRITFKARNKGNLSTQINSINDDGRVISGLWPIRFRGVSQSVDPNVTQPPGAPALPSSSVIDEKRRFPAGALRCSNKQIQITNAKVGITNSDALGLASLNGSAKTVTLNSGNFPANMSDHVIAFGGDGFVQEFTILSQSGGVITVSDPGSVMPTAINSKWVIRGYPKDEILQLLSFVLHFALLGKQQKGAAGESGEDA